MDCWLFVVSRARALAGPLPIFASRLLRSRSVPDMGCDALRVDWSLDAAFGDRVAGDCTACRKDPALLNGI